MLTTNRVEVLELRLADDGRLVRELKGTSPAVIRELLRRAALVAAEQCDGPLRVTERHLLDALRELRGSGAGLTRILLGAEPGPVA